MATGDIDDIEGESLEPYLTKSPELKAYLKVAFQYLPVREFFIPFGAGISEDGHTVYISRDMQTVIEGVECENALVRHETVEWGLRHFLEIGQDYGEDPTGHRIANRVEFDRVRQLIDRPDALHLYQNMIDYQVVFEEKLDFTTAPVPCDLALYPYEDDSELLEKLQEAMWNDRSLEIWDRLHPEKALHVEQASTIQEAVDDRLKRDAFLYLDPKPPANDFAQCSTCSMWITTDLCSIHGPDVKVTGSMSCGLYVNGQPSASGDTKAVVTPTESGLVDRPVRCENCKWFIDGICYFFSVLNRKMPSMFNLDEKVDAKGCCNANQPKGD